MANECRKVCGLIVPPVSWREYLATMRAMVLVVNRPPRLLRNTGTASDDTSRRPHPSSRHLSMVGSDSLQRHALRGNDALFSPFPADSHQSFAPADIIAVHADQFTDPSSRRIQRFQYGAVTQGVPFLIAGKFHQRAGIVLGENAREMFGKFRRPHILRRIYLQLANTYQITK